MASDPSDDLTWSKEDLTWSKMVGQLARGWAKDKYRRNKKFHKQVLYETLDAYVTLRWRETGENEGEATQAAADLYGVDKRTVERARREIREMRSSDRTAASRR
jgi:hypothetical protein